MQTFYILNATGTVQTPEAFSGLVVLYPGHEVPATAAQQTELIQKLVENGMKVSLDRTIIIDVKKQPVRWSALRKQVSVRYLMLMGLTPAEIGLNIEVPFYGAATIGDTVVIHAQAPEIMAPSSDLKGRLWKQITQSIPMPL